jgi:FkbM family methyltransferase
MEPRMIHRIRELFNFGVTELQISHRRLVSLNEDDEIIYSFFRDTEPGFYIDIGAGRPISHSLTFLLYKKGWNGFCFDPLPENQILHRLFRPRGKFKRCLIGNSLGGRKFYHLKHWSYSTSLESVASMLITNGTAKLVKELKIDQRPLRDFLKEIPSNVNTFLKTDTEGNDLDVLVSNDWEQFNPNLVCVEVWKEGKKSITSFLNGKGYALIAETKQNAFFAKL